MQVSNDDNLSKFICHSCLKRLEGIHRFATMAHKAQEKLKTKFYEISEDNDKLEDNKFDDNNENNKNDIIKSNFTDKASSIILFSN